MWMNGFAMFVFPNPLNVPLSHAKAAHARIAGEWEVRYRQGFIDRLAG